MIVCAVKSPQGRVSNDKVKERINKNEEEESEGGDTRIDPRDKKLGGGGDYLDILDPDRSNSELMIYCQFVLNR